jgi:hypothetical protein
MLKTMSRSGLPCRRFAGVLSTLLCSGWLTAATPVAGQGLAPAPPDAGAGLAACRAIQDDAARLNCYRPAESSLAVSRAQEVSNFAGAWRLVRSPNPAGGRDAVSIMHTGDLSRSDLEFAGLMLRCGEHAIETLIVLVQPLPPRAHPKVMVAAGHDHAEFTASVVTPGALVLLPPEVLALVEGPWQTAPELAVSVEDEQTRIRGVVALAGLGAALQALRASCPMQ